MLGAPETRNLFGDTTAEETRGKKLFLDAAAITLGVVLVCGVSYELLEDIRLISGEPQISFLIVLMSLTFVAANYVGTRKYR